MVRRSVHLRQTRMGWLHYKFLGCWNISIQKNYMIVRLIILIFLHERQQWRLKIAMPIWMIPILILFQLNNCFMKRTLVTGHEKLSMLPWFPQNRQSTQRGIRLSAARLIVKEMLWLLFKVGTGSGDQGL